MIEINLARQIEYTTKSKRVRRWLVWIAGGLLFLGIGLGSWMWIQSQDRYLEYLLQEKNVRTQTLISMRETLKKWDHDEEQKKTLIETLKKVRGLEREKNRPVLLLDGVSRSISSLGIWLERIQFESQVVEIGGESLVLEDIGRFIDVLENTQVIASSPTIEILDQETNKEAVSFTIRFKLKQQVTI